MNVRANARVAAIIVTYNRLDLLKTCISRVREQSYHDLTIIVVNNGSTDGTKEYLDNIEDAVVIHQDNRGGAGGFHTGMKAAYEAGYDWVWMMDDDGKPDKKQLEELLKGAERTSSKLVNAMVCDINDPNQLSSGLRYKGKKLKSCSEAMNYLEIPDIIRPFNGTLIHRDVIDKIGLVKKEMYIWGDEMEYTYRAQKAGFQLYTIPLALHYHPKGKKRIVNVIPYVSFYQIPSFTDDGRKYIWYRNRGYIMKLYFPNRIIKFLVLHLTYYILRLDLKGSLFVIRAFLKGVRAEFD